ncbi:MAG: sigma-70 family RNA polymerase sigma factor [Pseudomonadota bacterium]
MDSNTLPAEADRQRLAALISGVVERDDRALEQLYLATVDTIFGLVAKVLGVGPDAEEVTEDVYLYVWQNAQRYNPEQAHPIAWLIMLARSRAIDRHRQRMRSERLIDTLQKEEAPQLDETEALASVLDARLRDWLVTLPQPQRQIIAMAYFRGMTHREIAAQLQMSLGTVKTHIRRTLLALREAFESGHTQKS